MQIHQSRGSDSIWNDDRKACRWTFTPEETTRYSLRNSEIFRLPKIGANVDVPRTFSTDGCQVHIPWERECTWITKKKRKRTIPGTYILAIDRFCANLTLFNNDDNIYADHDGAEEEFEEEPAQKKRVVTSSKNWKRRGGSKLQGVNVVARWNMRTHVSTRLPLDCLLCRSM